MERIKHFNNNEIRKNDPNETEIWPAIEGENETTPEEKISLAFHRH